TNVNPPWLQQSGFLPVNNAGNTPYYENNGFATWLVTTTNSTSLTWSFQPGLDANVGNWTCLAAFFSAASGGGIPPSVPGNLVATAISSGQINLGWTASTDNVGV